MDPGLNAMPNRISIVIPCFNVENYIEEALASAFGQNWADTEVICIDNSSTDRTWSRLLQAQKRYRTLRIEKETSHGAPAARNHGFSISSGDWIQFLDADDLLMPEKLVHQAELISKTPDAAFVAGAYRKRPLLGNESIVKPLPDDPLKALFTTDLGITSSNLWNREYLEAVGGWNVELESSQEADLMFRILKRSEKVIFDPEPLTIVREREAGQITNRDPVKKWCQYIEVRLQILQWLRTDRPGYLQKNRCFFDDSLFSLIRILAEYDLQKAEEFYDRHLGKTYIPTSRQTHSGKPYLVLQKLFGFRKAEQIRKFIESLKVS
jgi:glycosyltransferase involved in cell wall biosynthesis